MKYFIDCEFLEGKQNKTFLGFKYGETKPTIDLISIGIVAEDGREFYAISKDFNLKEAWNRYDLVINKQYPLGSEYDKVYWIRENVLKPIYLELLSKETNMSYDKHEFYNSEQFKLGSFEYKQLKLLINKYGKTNKQIAEDILWFCAAEKSIFETDGLGQEVKNRLEDNPVKFYGYYSAYDHVCLSWLYGKMIDLPKGFPDYIIDLKQELDNKLKVTNTENKLWCLLDDIDTASDIFKPDNKHNYTQYIYSKLKHHELISSDGFTITSKYKSVEDIKNHKDYPKQTNEHNALSDARFNKELYEFLNKL